MSNSKTIFWLGILLLAIVSFFVGLGYLATEPTGITDSIDPQVNLSEE